MEHIYLSGSEDVRSAGHAMVRAAEEMSNAGGNIEDSLRRHREFMDEWLGRLEQILADDREAR